MRKLTTVALGCLLQLSLVPFDIHPAEAKLHFLDKIIPKAHAQSPTITNIMLAPFANATFVASSGNVYVSQNNGLIPNVQAGDISSLQGQGCVLLTPRNNASAMRAPLGTDDFTANYGVGSYWVNLATTTPTFYILTSMGSTAGSATWTLAPGGGGTGWPTISAITLNVSTTGVASGSCPISAPCTLAYACLLRYSFNSFSTTLNLAIGNYAQTPDGFNAQCSMIGNGGGGATTLTTLNGDCVNNPPGVLIAPPANSIGIFVKDLAELQVHCILIGATAPATGATDFSVGQFAVLDLDRVYFGSLASGIGVQLFQSASANLIGPLNILNGASLSSATVFYVASNANISFSGATINIPTAFAPTYFAYNQGGNLNGTIVFSGAGVAGTTGTSYFLDGGGCSTQGQNPENLFPGSTKIALPTDACIQGDPSTTVATLPTCNAAQQKKGKFFMVTDSNTSTIGATISGGGSSVVRASCNGTNYVVTY